MSKSQKPALLTPNECRNCGAPVRVTKPSTSGLHYCPAPACRAARQRALYADRAAKTAVLERQLVLAFIHALANEPREQCQSCGLVDALPGYPHPDEGGNPCRALGATRMGGLARQIVDAVWPSSRRTYSRD